MAAVLIQIPDKMLEVLDKEVERRKAKFQAQGAKGYSTPAQKQEALRLAKVKGAQVANQYLKDIRPLGSATSRTGLVLELVKAGLEALPQ